MRTFIFEKDDTRYLVSFYEDGSCELAVKDSESEVWGPPLDLVGFTGEGYFPEGAR